VSTPSGARGPCGEPSLSCTGARTAHGTSTCLHVRSADGPLRLAADGETFDGSADVVVAKTGDRLVLYSRPET